MFGTLFNNPKIECPRCLGKGEVDNQDIERLGKALYWIPGHCAYCNGVGKLHQKLINKVNADCVYLSADLPKDERLRLFHGDAGALARARHYENQVENFINEIEYLYSVGNLSEQKIVEFYLLSKKASKILSKEKEELLDFIRRVIKK